MKWSRGNYAKSTTGTTFYLLYDNGQPTNPWIFITFWNNNKMWKTTIDGWNYISKEKARWYLKNPDNVYMESIL